MAWARVNASSTEVPSFTASWSFLHTVNTGSNKLLIVGISIYDTDDHVASVTWNGTPCSKAIDSWDIDTGIAPKAAIYYLVNPAVGTYPVNIVFGGGAGFVAGCVAGASTWTGIDQATPLRTGATGVVQTTSTDPNVNVVGCSVDDLVYGVVIRNGSTLSTADSEDWLKYNTNDNEIGGGAYQNGTAGTVQVNWTSAVSTDWSSVGVAFRTAVDAQSSQRPQALFFSGD